MDFHQELIEYEREYHAQWQRDHRPECKINEQRYRDGHKEQRYAFQMKWNKENKDKRAEYSKKNSEKVKAAGAAPDRKTYMAEYYKKKGE